MAGSTFGTLFTITTWGESHGPALGVVVDGCPAGIPLTSDYIQTFLDRRKPGQSKFTTARKESDSVEILSGVFEGYTTGTPISLIVRNTDQRSHDYSKIKDCYRPGHADYTFDQKYGVRDYRGGGRTSGRETIGRVAGGAIACRILKHSEFILPLTPKLSDLFLFLLMHMITLQLTRTGFICRIRNMLNRQVHISNPVSENRILPVD